MNSSFLLVPTIVCISLCFDLCSSLSTTSSSASSDPWRLVEIKFTNQNVETSDLLADFLLELGACSTSIVDHDKGTEEEDPIFIAEKLGISKMLWRNADVSAHFPAASFDAQSIAESVRVAFEMGSSPRFEVEGVEDKDWILHVQESWKPCVVASFLLRFPWHDDKVVAEALDEAGLSIPINRHLKLQGGMAFGTGEHPTTRLCLEFVAQAIENIRKHSYGENKQKIRFLDYGAGSGVLGLAACIVGLPDLYVESTGVEIDADAVQIANVNAKENNLPMTSFLPMLDRDRLDDESLSVTLRGRSRADTLPDELEGPIFDACAANILAAPLCGLAPIIASHLKPGAMLGLSGILTFQGDDILNAYKTYFYDCKVTKEEEGWVLITGYRNQHIVTLK